MTVCVEEVDIYGWPMTTAWDSGARFDYLLEGDLYVRFTFSSGSAGVVIGINEADYTAHHADIAHGLMLWSGRVHPVEFGDFVGDWSTHDSKYEYIIARRENQVLYLRRDTLDPETVFYDDALPGVPLPGELLYISGQLSYGPRYIDSSFYAVGDSACLVDWASGAYAPEDLVGGAGGTVTGQLPLEILAAGSPEAAPDIAAIISGDLPFSATISGSALEGVYQGQLWLDGFAADDSITGGILRGRLAFAGGSQDGTVGSGSISTDQTGQLARMVGYLPLDGVASGEDFYPQGVDAGALPLVLVATGGEYEVGVIRAGLHGELPLDGAAAGRPTASAAVEGAATGDLPLVGVAAGRPTADDEITAGATGDLLLTLEAVGVQPGDNRQDADPAESWLYVELPLEAAITGSTQYTNFINIIMPEFADTQLTDEVEITEGILATAEQDVHYVNLVSEFAQLVATPATFTQIQAEILEQAGIVATTLPAFVQMVSDIVQSADTTQANSVVALAEFLQAEGVVQTVYHGVVALAATIVTGDDNRPAYAAIAADSLEVATAEQVRSRLMAELLDQATALAVTENVLLVEVEETSVLAAGDSIELDATLLAELLDTVQVQGLFKTSGDIAQTWVMNTAGAKPLSEYDNYEFTSMAFFGGRMYGTRDDGLYVLEGDLDAGAEIYAQIGSLALDFGSSRQKRIRGAYLGYTSAGPLVMKVIAESDGQFTEHWYKAQPVGVAESPRAGYFEVGQGLRSRYWRFELTNVDGCDFEIDEAQMHPLLLNRRL